MKELKDLQKGDRILAENGSVTTGVVVENYPDDKKVLIRIGFIDTLENYESWRFTNYRLLNRVPKQKEEPIKETKKQQKTMKLPKWLKQIGCIHNMKEVEQSEEEKALIKSVKEAFTDYTIVNTIYQCTKCGRLQYRTTAKV